MNEVEPRLVVAEIMRRKGYTASSLAAAIGKPSLQSTISRYLNGHTKNPRWSWTFPAAGILRIDTATFQSATVAAMHRDVPDNAFAPVKVGSTTAGKSKRIDPGDLAIQINRLLRPYDPAVRRAAADLLFSAALGTLDSSRTANDHIGEIARRLRAMLADEP